MVKLREITNESWLVDDKDQLGILSKQINKYVLSKGRNNITFKDKEEVSTFFKEDVFSTVSKPEENPISYFINGFPVDFEDPVLVEDSSSDLPLYSKTAKKNILYCAGYYCVKFSKRWTYGKCPKKVTLETYEYKGPFKTEKEAKEIAKILREKDEEKI